MNSNEIMTALLSMRIFATTQEWPQEVNSGATGFNACGQCGALDFRGHQPNCIMPPLLLNFDKALEELKVILKYHE